MSRPDPHHAHWLARPAGRAVGLVEPARGNRPGTPHTPATHPRPCTRGGAVAAFENSKSVSEPHEGPGPKTAATSERGRDRD